MLYLIKDKRPLGIKTIAILQSEEEVLKYLSKKENLKKIKGDIKIETVRL